MPATRPERQPATASEIRVLLADADALHRARLRTLLHTDAGVRVVAEAPTAQHAIGLALRTHPDVLLIDSTLPGLDVVELLRRIDAGPASARVLIHGDDAGDDHALAALRAGAGGLVAREPGGSQLVHAVRLVAEGGVVLVPTSLIGRITAASATHLSSGRLSRLTIREAEVISLVARGLRNTEIADALQISAETVKTHLRNAMRKLGVHGRAELVALAYDTRLVEPRPVNPDE